MKYTIKSPAKFKFKEKRSEFISFAEPVKSAEDIRKVLQQYKQKFPDARHICYAYVLDDKEYSSDAGEPKGSAGPPILAAIKKEDLTNVIVVVIRYFGGVKLGVRGLINAYGYAAQKVLEQTEKIPYIPTKKISIEVPYNNLNRFYYQLNKSKGKILQQTSKDNSIDFLVELPEEENLTL